MSDQAAVQQFFFEEVQQGEDLLAQGLFHSDQIPGPTSILKMLEETTCRSPLSQALKGIEKQFETVGCSR